LYDIFAAIIEMWNEIIQGSRPEFLNHLGNSILNPEAHDLEQYLSGENSSNKRTEIEYRVIEKVDVFQYFIKTVIEFIFRDRNTLELLYKIKNKAQADLKFINSIYLNLNFLFIITNIALNIFPLF